MINMTPADLDAFVAVAATGSFRHAAQQLGVSQPTVSARIRHLEAVLGVTLFHRTTRRVAITDAGERLRARVERMVLETRSLLAEFKDEAHLKRGRLAVGASPSVAASILPGAIRRFQRRWPDVDVELLDDFYGQAMDRVGRGEVDLVVSPYVGDEETYVFEPLLEDTFLLAVPVDHALAARASVTLAEVAAERQIAMPPESAAWAVVRRAFSQAGIDYTPAMMTRYSLTLVALVKQGLGVGLVTEMLARALDMSGLRLLPVSDADLTRRIGIVTSRDRAPSAAAAAFRDLLLKSGPELEKDARGGHA